MANKKVFSIEINGLTESVKSVGALEEKLSALQAQINKMKKQGIEIPIEVGGEDLVKEMKAISNKIKKATTGALPIAEEKEYAKALRERQKALDAVNKELGDTGKNLAEYKQETKELVAQEQKARNEAKTYANTLNGLKAELKDLNNIKGNLDLNSEEYAEVSQQILQLTTRLKEYEAAQGSFGRNVGNYKNEIKSAVQELGVLGNTTSQTVEEVQRLDAALEELAQTGTKDLNLQDLEQYGITIDQVRQRMETLTKLRNASVMGSTEYQEYDRLLDVVKKVDNELKRLQGTVVKADNQLKTQLQRTINGTTYTWETLTSAVGELEDKLYQLASSGQRNTAEFEAIAQAAAELKIQLRQVDYEIDAMVESSRGIQRLVTYAQGFTAIAQGGIGLQQLFGMNDEDSLKSIQTLQALQGIAMSLQTVKELAQRDNSFGELLKKWNESINNVLGRFTIFRAEIPKAMEAAKKSMEEFQTIVATLEAPLERFGNMAFLNPSIQATTVNLTKELREEFERLIARANTFEDISVSTYEELLQAEKQFASMGTAEGDAMADKIYNLKVSAREASKEMLTLKKAGFGLMGYFASAIGTVKNWIDSIRGVKDSSKDAAASVLNMSKGLKAAIAGMKAAEVAAKALRATLKAFIIFEVINLLFKLVDGIIEAVKWTYQWATGNDKLVDSMSTLEGRLSYLNARLERYISLLEKANREGRLSDLGKATLQYTAYSNAVNEATKQLKEFVKLRDDAKKLEDNLKSSKLTTWANFKDIEAFRLEYEKLLKAVESGTDVKQQGGNWFEKLWYTKKDAKSDLGVMQKRVIEDIQNRINNLDLSKGTEELEKFFEIMNEEMYATSIANIENLFPEEEWASVLKKRLESLRTFFEQSKDASTQLDEVVRAKTKAIRDNETEAIKESQERELKALRNAMADEILAAKNDQEIIVSIQAKYQRLEEEMLDRHSKEILAKHRDLQRQIRDNYLSAEDESLIKRIQEINNERYDAIEDAKLAQAEAEKQGLNMTEQYNQLILSINKKYDAEIVRAKQDYYDTLRDELDKYRQDVIKAEEDIARDRLDKVSQDAEIKYNVAITSGQSINYKAQLSEIIKQEKENNKYRLEVELQYLKEKKALDDQYATLDRDSSSSQEKNRYKKALESLQEFKRQGNATEEEYNKLVEQEAELHQKNLQRIQEHYQSTMEVNEKNHQSDMQKIIGQYLQQDIDLYQEYMDKANDILTDVGREVNIFKIMKFSDGNAKFKEALDYIKQGLQEIEKERENIDKKLATNEITVADANAAKKQLEETEKELKKGAKDITLMQKDFFGEVAGQWKQMIDQWVGAISGLLQTLNDTQMQLIENQMAEIERQLEIQEQAYEKAEEAAQEHKDKMDGIEDELAEARGSRRQFLIDTYAAQQAAYLEDLAAQQKAAEEKEKLEKEQEALEKKRKQQEKKANVQQAIINAYTAASNALAVQPWFVGLALSAVALGMGLANVAAIKNTPIYEDGGVLGGGVISGPRHSQGGVKVLGGAAEVEGGEYITNRKTTAANLPLLTYINDQKRELTAEDLLKFFASGTPKVKARATRMFANGGQLPTTNTEVSRIVQVNDTSNENAIYVVQVTDIINAADNLRKVQTLSGLYNE